MIIQHNIMSLNAYNRLGANNGLISKNLEKLSSGYKINRAADDAAGLAISEKMRAQITGLTRATQNSQDGISLVQTAEGNLTEVHSMLNRMVDLATQSSNGTIDNDVDRKNLQKEVQSLKDEINRIADSSHFNGIKLLNGGLGMGVSSTVGAAGAATTTVLDFSNMQGNFVPGATVTIKGTGSDGTSVSHSFEFSANATDALKDATATRVVIDADGKNDSLAALTTAIADAGATGEPLVGYLAATGGATRTNSVITLTTLATTDETYAAAEISSKNIGLNLQIGDTASQRVTVSVNNMNIKSLGLDLISVATETGATNAIDLIKTAINTVSGTRADLGAIQNRLEHTINNLTTTTENMTAAESRIRDTDMAKEMMNFTKNNVLSQAAQSMLAQANQQPQQVLQLLQ